MNEDDDLGTLAVTAGPGGGRLDVALTEAARDAGVVLSRTRIKALIEAGALSLDGVPVLDANRKLKGGEALVLVVPPVEEAEPQGEAISLSIRYEDAHLVVVDKPAGLVVHPAPGHATGTLVNALIAPLRRQPIRHRRGQAGRASCTGSTRTHPAFW